MQLLAALTAFLVWLTSTPHALELERPRAEAAVAAAYASLLPPSPAPAPPNPAPPAPAVCPRCNGKGYIVHGDGHRTTCPCRTTTCTTGTCRPAP